MTKTGTPSQKTSPSSNRTIATRRTPVRRVTTARYEIDFGRAEPAANNPVKALWSRLRRGIDPLVAIGRNAIGNVYVSAAKAVYERAEALEDLQAERQSRRRTAALEAAAKQKAAKKLDTRKTVPPAAPVAEAPARASRVSASKASASSSPGKSVSSKSVSSKSRPGKPSARAAARSSTSPKGNG